LIDAGGKGIAIPAASLHVFELRCSPSRETCERANMISIRPLIACSALSMLGGGTIVLAAQQTQTSHREDQFENAYLKSWKTVVMPGTPLALHRHDHGK
jgi:hypothetical protein